MYRRDGDDAVLIKPARNHWASKFRGCERPPQSYMSEHISTKAITTAGQHACIAIVTFARFYSLSAWEISDAKMREERLRGPRTLTSVINLLKACTVLLLRIPTHHALPNSERIHTTGVWRREDKDGEALLQCVGAPARQRQPNDVPLQELCVRTPEHHTPLPDTPSIPSSSDPPAAPRRRRNVPFSG